MPLKIAQLVERLRSQPADANERGNAVHRMFAPSERYVVDFAEDFGPGGWLQFDTDQDAAYFGVWLNPGLLLTLTYAEGDWSLVACPDADHYLAEVRDAIRFYDEGFVFKTVGASGVTTYRQDRDKFLQLP